MGDRLFLRLEEDALQGPESSVPAGALRSFAVSEPLRAHVSSILLYREALPAGVEVEEHVIPDGLSRLVFNLGDAPSTGSLPSAVALVAGASATPTTVRMRGRMNGLFGASRRLRATMSAWP